jgi:hypothetical protein
MKNVVISIVMVLASSISLADQCAYISKEQAIEAVQILSKTNSVQILCELCGDTEATTLDVKTFGMRSAGYQNYSEVVINDLGIDLAYTYVNGVNLALLVKCPTQGVRPSL